MSDRRSKLVFDEIEEKASLLPKDVESQEPSTHYKLMSPNNTNDPDDGKDETTKDKLDNNDPLEFPEDSDEKKKKMNLINKIVHYSAHGLGAAVWFSTTFFAIFIFFHYIVNAARHKWSRWNCYLPLKDDNTRKFSTAAMMIHLLSAMTLLLLGNIQLLPVVRKKAPKVHRWCGRIYVTCAFLAGLFGTLYVIVHGTAGKTIQNIGFGIYGALTLLSSVMTYYYIAVKKDIDTHSHWGIRTYVLSIGSWLYRMGYGVWFTFFGKAGIHDDFHGPYDIFMDFGFFIIPLLVAEAYIRSSKPQTILSGSLLATLLITTLLVTIASTAMMMGFRWIPAIISSMRNDDPQCYKRK